MKWLKFIFALAPIFIGLNALALPTLQPRMRDSEIRLGLTGNYYLTKGTDSLADDHTGNTAVTIAGRKVGHQDQFSYGVDGEGLYGLGGSNFRYLNIAEGYVGWNNNRWSAFIGRKRYAWNNLDSYWSLGLFQPRFRWDYLNEKENGLFGFFAGYQSPGFSIVGFASPLFIPEQGAPFDIANGSCKSASPWFSCPASSIFLFNETTDVNFKLEIPSVRKIVMNPAGGVTARVGKDTGPFARLAYIHKPINQLLLSFEGRLSLSSSAIPAVIRPRVLYHDLTALDAGWNSERHSLTASTIWELPRRDYTPPSWNTQEISPALLTGATLKTMPFSESFKFTRFEFSYFHRHAGNNSDRGPFVNADVATFEPRYAFKNAYSAAIFTPIADAWARTILFSTKFIYDSLNRGNILISDLYYRPLSPLFFNVGMDMLGSDSRKPDDFISRYQRNDRVRGAVNYAF